MSNSFLVLTDIFWDFWFWFIWGFLFVGVFFPFLFGLGFYVFGLGIFLCLGFFLNFVFNLKVKGHVLVLYFGDLDFYKVEYLFYKYSTVFDNSYLEHHNRIFERNNYETPKYLAKSSNTS